MYEPNDEERKKVALDALKVLWGADVAQRRLLAGLSMGTPSIDHTTYLIKTRIKDHNSIVAKVFNRRAKTPDYQANNVTDIIGVRILTLYRSDLPVMLQRFLRFVADGCRSPFQLFAGDSVKDAVSELIIYGYPTEQPLCRALVSQLRQFDLAVDGKRIATISKPSAYSSIHLLLRAQASIGESRFAIPVEVQIRTVLEDTWGEVQHALMYKLEANQVASRDPDLFEIAERQLSTWKAALDNCGDQADAIRQLMKVWEGRADSAVAFKSIDDQELTKLGLPQPIQQKVNDAVARIELFFKQIDDPEANSPLASSIQEFVEVAVALQECLRGIEPHIQMRPYQLLTMELALCLLWLGRLLHKGSAHSATSSHDILAVRQKLEAARVLTAHPERSRDYPVASIILEEAESRYFSLEKSPGLASNPIIAYRLGEVMSAKDERDIAIARFEEANSLLPRSNLRGDHPMRVQIPRRLGFAYWEAADALKEKALQFNKDFALSKRIELYEKAIIVTQQALAASPGVDWNRADDYAPGAYNLATINNLLDYSIEYLKTGASTEALSKFNLDAAKVEELFKQLAPNGDLSRIVNPPIADTIREAARYFGQRKMEILAARRVQQLIHSKDWSGRFRPEGLAAMLRDANASLQEPPPPPPAAAEKQHPEPPTLQ